MTSDRRGTLIRFTAYGVVLLLLVLLAYLAITGFTAFRALSNARADLATAERTVSSAPDRAQSALASAQTSAQSAQATLQGPVWSVVSSLPYLGATPKTAAVVAQSLNEALMAIEPALGTLDILKPSSLVSQGRIDITAVQQAVPVAQETLPALRDARSTLDSAPTSGLLMAPVRNAADQLAAQLDSLQATLSTAVTFGKVAGPLLGQDGTKRYFLGLLNPNEARGTGGFLGTYGILTATDGQLTVSEIGSNSDIPDLQTMPAEIGEEFRNRYGNDPLRKGNMNLSPHFPDSARLWLAAWKAKTGEELDGAMAMDVVSMGRLVAASGQTVALPNGLALSGPELIRFALRDVYLQFPDARVRKEYQEAVAASALATVTSLPKPLPMAEVFGQSFSEGRIVVWSRDSEVERELQDAGISGSIAVGDGHHVQVVLLNASGSKLDAWLSRDVSYEVGRCVDEQGRVESAVTVSLRSDVPLGDRPPSYMMGSARQSLSGPVNFVFVQVHLPNGSEVGDVNLNGTPLGRFTFTEQGRPAVMGAVELPPRVTERVTVTFSEPGSEGAGMIAEQPLGTQFLGKVTDRECG